MIMEFLYYFKRKKIEVSSSPSLFQLLPVSATFKFISSYEDFSKPHCLLALVELAKHLSSFMG